MSSYPDKLPITPFARPVHGSVRLPGSKSITNRALILAALTRGKVVAVNDWALRRHATVMWINYPKKSAQLKNTDG